MWSKGCSLSKTVRIAFCKEHYLEGYLKRVQETIKEFRMFGKGDRVLVAISGGKDSLSLWDALHRLGYEAGGLYIDLAKGTIQGVLGKYVKSLPGKGP